MHHQIRTTADGSSTLYIPELNEHYHSIHGACQESVHVFINAGLLQFQHVKKEIKILEVGLGTGLNVLLSARFAEDCSMKLDYLAIEPYPIDDNLLRQLNYNNLNQFIIPENWIHKIAEATKAEKVISLHTGFKLSIIKETIETFELPKQFDLVYFDAFGPQVQPEIWSELNFKKIFDSMNPGGILVTYCAKGAVRRSMQNAGFVVERIPGPPGKREMLRAKK